MRVRVGLAAGCIVGLAAFSGVSAQAATTPVFYDDYRNLGAQPNPFPALNTSTGSARENTAAGMGSLAALTTGYANTAIGQDSLRNLTSGGATSVSGFMPVPG